MLTFARIGPLFYIVSVLFQLSKRIFCCTGQAFQPVTDELHACCDVWAVPARRWDVAGVVEGIIATKSDGGGARNIVLRSKSSKLILSFGYIF
ncbi:MAG: hypothetical protein OXG78_03580 [Chloroflexi bacterium]|nr:hypothetical protein [Chloroflexota bacterium]